MNVPWHPVQPLDQLAFENLRRRAMFQCFKWDLQMEDVCTLSRVPIVLQPDAWVEMSRMAEELAQETLAAENELARRPDLHERLGLPRQVVKQLKSVADPALSQRDVRVIRFDFHYTSLGWRISEANTDVPGGFNEAARLTDFVRAYYRGLNSVGDPAKTVADAIQARNDSQEPVALVHATAFTDDRQVMLYLAAELQSIGLKAQLISPDQLLWKNGYATVCAAWYKGPAGFIFRFFPAEWLPNLPCRCGWQNFFHGARTPLSNPATALLTQTKRFPLVWDDLQTPLPAWRRLMPETRDPRQTDWPHQEDWVLKPALGRVGDMIGLRGITDKLKWEQICRSVRKTPQWWAAQRRFLAVPMEANDGPLYPCIGVYTVNGRVAGAYGRLARVPLIDQFAQDAAVLVA